MFSNLLLGMMADVGRNFVTKESILKLLDVMGMYKLNKFHFHLSDDEGWRLEIPGIPELTEVMSLLLCLKTLVCMEINISYTEDQINLKMRNLTEL